jgi:hypothetical protein
VGAMDVDSKTTDQRGRVEVPTGNESASAVEDTAVWLTIGQRLAAIRAESFGIGKQAIQMESAKGGKYTIQAHTVEAILAEIRPLLAKYGVDLTPNLVSREYSGNRCDVMVDFTFEVLDLFPDVPVHQSMPLTRTIRWAGAGTDNSDKGFAKAGTNALKEMLKKTFLITDREDAKEEEDKIEHEAEGVNRRDLEKAKEKSRAAIENWAKGFRDTIRNAKDSKDLSRIQRENNDQLMSDDLAEITRQYFLEEIAKKKAELIEFAGDTK